MSIDVHYQAILVSLQPLFETAERDQLWFYHLDDSGEDHWFSPGYLQAEHAKGRLILAPEHWELRNPVGYLNHLINDVSAKIDEYNALAKRLGYEETLALESHSTHPADAH